MDSLYNENHIWGSLFRKFMDLLPQATKPTKKLLALFLIGQLCTEHFTSVRNLHKTFLSSVCDKKLNSYYHALSNDKIANTQIRQILAKSHGQWSLFCDPYNVCSGNGNSKRLPATNPLCYHFYRICHVDS